MSSNIEDYKLTEYFSDGESDSEYSAGNEISEDQADDYQKCLAHLHLRNYQEELAEAALQGLNTVICAPTGSGKTRVATYIILNHLNDKNGAKKKKVAFLARTVPLTIQQYKSLYKYLPSNYKITYITGDSQDSMNLQSVIKHYDIIVMTPMILQNNVVKTGLRLSKFSLLVFDECHHTRKGEPYNQLMSSYLFAKLKGSDKAKARLPKIVGLTASIGIENGKTVKEASESILNVLSNLDAPCLSTVKKFKEELEELTPVPYERFELLTERDGDEAVKTINDVLEKLESWIKKYAKDLKDDSINILVSQLPSNRKTQAYGQWAVKLKQHSRTIPISDVNKETKLEVRALMILSDYLVHYNVALEAYDLVELKDIINYLDNHFEKCIYFGVKNRTQQEEIFYKYFSELKAALSRRASVDENPNLIRLSKILLEKLKDKGDDARCIIFVRTRALAESLAQWFNRHSILALKDLNAKIFTGINAAEEEGGMTPKLQDDTLQSFRDGVTKVLVATSVAEEGLDIADCNLIIKYNHVGNEVSTIQTKGRARKRGGFSVLLAMENVLCRERGNQEKTKLMLEAIQEISKMNPSEIIKYLDNYQKKRIEDEELEAQLASDKRMPQEKVFTMVCSQCRKVGIDNTKLRTILGVHRVSIDSELLQSDKVKLANKKENYRWNRISWFSILSRQNREGKICGNTLGTRIKYKKTTYFALGIKNFGFFIGLDTRLQHYKKWDQVPYSVEEIDSEDKMKYVIGDERSKADMIFEDESSSSEEEIDGLIQPLQNTYQGQK
uniref:RNA helicase n=1 Tax=Biomphalaria glabrata TaxID=6526 RepID=A0A2C9L1C0_BIOGL